MSRASSSSLKGTEIQKKRNIKSRKIDKRKRKMLMSKVFHNIIELTMKMVATYVVGDLTLIDS